MLIKSLIKNLIKAICESYKTAKYDAMVAARIGGKDQIAVNLDDEAALDAVLSKINK